MNFDMKIAGEYLEKLLNYPATPAQTECEDSFFYPWSPDMPFALNTHTQSLIKQEGKDFVILNLADIQCHDAEAFCQVGDFYEETVDKLIKRVQPDLITLTGDNAFDPFAYMKLIDFLESYGIAWAPVMGNADQRGLVSEFWADYRLTRAKHCLFQCGPQGMGDGNYIVNIMQNNEIIHTLFFMDTHHEEEMQAGSYDHFYRNQLDWYRWAVEGLKQHNGKTVNSSVFMHIPVPEYIDAWNAIQDKQNGGLLAPFNTQRFCQVHENFGSPVFNNGFFDLCKALGSTVNMICGHDHKNCFSIPYKGITLTYAMKTGYGCYWERQTNGGTVLRIHDNGATEFEHCYINPENSQVKMFMLEYYGKNLYKQNDD